jgi:hypothetical protein
MRNNNIRYVRNPHFGKITEVVVYEGNRVIKRMAYDSFVDEMRRSRKAATVHFAVNGNKPLCHTASEHPVLTRLSKSVSCKRCLRSLAS